MTPHQQQSSRTWDAVPTPRFQTIKFLGRGGQGFVQLAYDNLHEQHVAIKYIDRGWSRGFYKYVLRETLNHQQLSLCKHPHIVEFHEVFLTPSYLAVVMEYVNGTNLQHYLETAGGKLPEDVARFIFQQLVIAVDFCHKKGKVNRDIKLANILLQEGHLPLVKLCDFGFSKDKFDDSEPQTQIGTALFTAPEIFTNVPGQVYDAEAADVWSCGVVLFVMLFGCHPFLSVDDAQQRKHAQVMKLIENAVRGNVQVPEGVEELYPQALDLVRHILVSAPSQRSKLPSIMAHSWFQEKLPPGALLLNAAYLSMRHPVGELRQTPEELHAIITAALSVSGPDEQSDCNSPAPMADGMPAVSGPPPPPPQAHQRHQHQHNQQLQPQQPAAMTPMASTSAHPRGSQQVMLHSHHHAQHQQQSPEAAGLLPQHAQTHPQVYAPPATLMAHPAPPHVHHPVVGPHQQPRTVHTYLPELEGQPPPHQQLLGSGPTSNSLQAAVAGTVGPLASLQATGAGANTAHLAPPRSLVSESAGPMTGFHPHQSPTASNRHPTVHKPEAPPSSPIQVSADRSIGRSTGSVPPHGRARATGEQVGPLRVVPQTSAPGVSGPGSGDALQPHGTRPANSMSGVRGCVLYDSSLLYSLDLQTED